MSDWTDAEDELAKELYFVGSGVDVPPEWLSSKLAQVRAEALEEAAKVCESKEIPFDIELWHNSTKKEMTAHTAIALAAAIRRLK